MIRGVVRMPGPTTQAMPSALTVMSEYDLLRGRVECLRARHDRFGWTYDTTVKVRLLAGITATAVAGVTAGAKLVSKSLITAGRINDPDPYQLASSWTASSKQWNGEFPALDTVPNVAPTIELTSRCQPSNGPMSVPAN